MLIPCGILNTCVIKGLGPCIYQNLTLKHKDHDFKWMQFKKSIRILWASGCNTDCDKRICGTDVWQVHWNEWGKYLPNLGNEQTP